MPTDNSRLTAHVAGPLIHPMLVPFPAVCFVGAFCTDIAYWLSADMQWANFSIWLITAGLVMAGLAVVAGLIDLLRSRRPRAAKPAWLRLLGAVLAIVLSVVNAFVHSRDAYTSVVPTGIALSGLVVLVLLATGCLRWSMVTPSQLGAMV